SSTYRRSVIVLAGVAVPSFSGRRTSSADRRASCFVRASASLQHFCLCSTSPDGPTTLSKYRRYHVEPFLNTYPFWWRRVLFMTSPFCELVPHPCCCRPRYAVPPTLPTRGYPNESARTCRTAHGGAGLRTEFKPAPESTSPGRPSAWPAPASRCTRIRVDSGCQNRYALFLLS